MPLTNISSMKVATPLRSLVTGSMISWKYPGAELMPKGSLSCNSILPCVFILAYGAHLTST